MPISKQDVIIKARAYLELQPVFLDSETTGMGRDDEIIDISVVDYQGAVILDSLVKPIKRIPADATRVHGISNGMVNNAPEWSELWPELVAALANKVVGIYNEEFDVRMMRQTARANKLQWVPPYTRSFCIMKLYAPYFGAWDDYHQDYTWQSLANAGRQCRINLPNTHRALADTFLSRAVLFHMAGKDWSLTS